MIEKITKKKSYSNIFRLCNISQKEEILHVKENYYSNYFGGFTGGNNCPKGCDSETRILKTK